MAPPEGGEHEEGALQKASGGQLTEGRPVVHVFTVDTEALGAGVPSRRKCLSATSGAWIIVGIRAVLAPEAATDQTCAVGASFADSGRTLVVLPVAHVNLALVSCNDRGHTGKVNGEANFKEVGGVRN